MAKNNSTKAEATKVADPEATKTNANPVKETRPGHLRPPGLLRRFPGGFPARIYQDGQGTEPFSESQQNFRRMRPAYVLPEIRGRSL